MSFLGLNRRQLRLFIYAFLHGIVLIIATLVYLNTPHTLEDESWLIQQSSVLKHLILKTGEKPPKDRFLFVNLTYSKVLVPKMDADSLMEIGKEEYTDRVKLAKLLKVMNDSALHKAALLDMRIYSELGHQYDSAFKIEIERLYKTIVSYHKNDDDSPYYPIWNTPNPGLSDMQSNLNMILKYQLVQGDSLKTTPLLLHEMVNGVKYEQGWLFDYIDGKAILNSFIIDYRIRNYNLLVEKIKEEIMGVEALTSAYNYYNLNELVEYPPALIAEMLKDRIVIIGDFEGLDTHETIYGPTAGPLILLNAFLALEAGDNTITWPFILFLLVGYTLISFKCFVIDDKIDEYIKGKVGHLPFGEFVVEFFGYVFFFAIMSVLSFLWFDKHLTVLLLAIYVHILEEFIQYFTKLKRKRRAKKVTKSIIDPTATDKSAKVRRSTGVNDFEGLRVIELANVLAGPSVGQFFAELGAEVIKVENPRTDGDVTRSWALSNEKVEEGMSAYFMTVNWGKKSYQIDLTSEDGVAELMALISKADIVISSFKSGDAEKLGVDYDTIQKKYPSVIYGHITGYGEDIKKVGYDAIIQAEAGFMYMNGTPDSLPVKMPVALIDVLAAHQLKEGLLVALRRKEHMKQKGSYVSVSLFDAALASLANQASNYLNADHIPQRIGSEHPNIAPYGTLYKTKDEQFVLLAVGTQRQFETLCSILKLDDLAKDNNMQSNALRVQNRQLLNEKLSNAIAEWKADELLLEFTKKYIPAGKVNSMDEVMVTPQAKAVMLKDENSPYKGIRQFIARIDGKLGVKLSAPPKYKKK